LKDKNEVLFEIDSVIDHNVFEEPVKHLNSLMKEIKELEEDMTEKNVKKEKNEIETRIENLTREAHATISEIERNKTQLKAIEVSIQERKTSLKKEIQRLEPSS